MESPLEVQKSIYGEDGPPMVFIPQASALHLEMRAKPPTVREGAPIKDPSRIPTSKKAMTKREIFAKVQEIKGSITYQQQQLQNGAEISSHQLSTCQLPGDFPPDLCFRSLAAYSLLRTLSVQLRLSPFTPNVFLRALALPAPNKLMGEIHVALLRILFVQKLKNMGYSYKAGGGGVGVNKKRQIDGIRWPLLAGDNLSHLDGLSWPLFYDDYCHLTADRLWASYHGSLDDDGDESSRNQNVIDFRNIGIFVPPRGEEYKTKQHTDGMTIPTTVSSRTKGDDGAKPITTDTRNETTRNEIKHNEQLPLHVSGSAIKEEPIVPTEAMQMVNSDNSDSEEEYKDTGEDDDDSEVWDDKPKKKKRRKMAKQNASPAIITNATTGTAITAIATTKEIPLAPKEGNSSSAPLDWSRVTSLESPASKPAATNPAPTEPERSQNLPSDPSWSRIASVEPSFSSPDWSPSKRLLGNPPLQPEIPSSAPDQMQTNVSTKSSQEVQSDQPIQPKIENQPSDQQQPNQEEGSKANEAEKTDDVPSASDPARIRGGGFVGDSKLTVPSNTGTSGKSLGRPRGSRMALPMRSNSSTTQTPSYSSQPHHKAMLQQQQYQSYQAQSQRNVAPLHATSQSYPSSNTNLSGTPSSFRPQKFVSNEKLNMQEESDVPFMAPNDIAKIVNDFVRGQSTHKVSVEGMEDIDSKNENSDTESVDVDPVFEEKLEKERWVHFKPLKAMRSGLPYHRLPIEEKLFILEFLIDELLTVDAISAEFTKRRHREEYRPFPYGILPKEHEYQNMENKDECNVCGQEGDLLCCDGCSSSYHSYCLGMETGQNLPEGKWLCPECSIVDPSNYGPLHGGQKGSLDWFTLEEIENVSKFMNHNYASNSLVSSVFTPTLSNATSQVGATMNRKERQFIIVHGFIFCREMTEGHLSFEALKSSKPYSSLTKGDLDTFVSQTDNTLLKAWPLVQIPHVKMSSSWKFPSAKVYFASKESMDPFLYHNKYYSAPISIMTKLGSAHNMVKLMYKTFETECNKPNTATISELLTQDFSFDSKISASLNTQAGLFDPFQVLKGYMLNLEHTLRRSCMVNEFWERGQFKSRGEIWIERVQEARSIRALSRLLLKLVNAMHTNAFSPSWFQSHVAKNADFDASESERNYQALPNDWSVEKEKLKRKWENTPAKMILSLCSDSEDGLLGFASKIRSDIFIPKQPTMKKKSKRKLKKVSGLTEQKKMKVEGEKALEQLNPTNQEKQGSPTLQSQQNHPQTMAREEQNVMVSDPSKIGNASIDSSKASKEAVCDSSVIASSVAPKTTMKKKLQEHQPNPAHSKTSEKSAGTDSPSPGSVDSVEKNELVEHFVEKTLPYDANDSKNFTPGSGNDSEQTEPIKEGSDSKIEDESNITHIEGENVSTPSEVREGETKTKESVSQGVIADESRAAKADKPCPPKKKRRKKSILPKPRDPSTRRRTRNSDRLSSEHLVRDSKVTNALKLDERNASTALEGLALQLESAKKQKIPGLEKLLKGQYAVQGIWPIAGRRIFPTIGNISPREMRRIARNAGSAIGANLSYHTNHEVAQVSYGHVWRKRVELCNRFEELLYLMRILESSLDRDTIRECEKLTRRGKNSFQKFIRCTIRNPSSGSLDHFLMNKKSLKGCWVPGHNLDLTPLIIDRFCRRQKQKEQRMERVRVKEGFERDKLETERRIRMVEATKKAQEEKLRKEEARRIAKLQKQGDLAKKKLVLDSNMKSRMMLAQQNRQQAAPSPEIKAWQHQLHMAFSVHEMQIEQALRSWQNNNSVPEKEIVKIRQKTLEKLGMINKQLARLNLPMIEGQQALARMFNHEKNAAIKMKKEKDGTMYRNSQYNFGNSNPNSNNAQSRNPLPGLGMNEQNRSHQNFGNTNSTVAPFNQPNIAHNMLSSQQIRNQIQPGGHNYANESSKQEFGFQNNPSRGVVANQSRTKQGHSQQNQIQGQNYGTPYFVPPDMKMNSRSTDMHTNNQQIPLPNQRMDFVMKPKNNARPLSPMQLAQLAPHQQKYQQQGNLTSQPPTQGTQQQQYQQRRNYSTSTLTPVQPMAQTQQQQQRDMNIFPPRQQTQQQLHRNQDVFLDRQGGQTHQNRPSQTAKMNTTIHSQSVKFNGAANQYLNQQPGQFMTPNVGNHTINGSSTNTWNNQSFLMNQYNKSSQQNQSSFSVNASTGQHQNQQNQQQQFRNGQYQLAAPTYMSQSMSSPNNSSHGSSLQPRTHNNSNTNQMNSGSQFHNLPNQPLNTGYGHPQSNNDMSQNNSQMLYGQNHQQQQSTKYSYGTNQTSQMNANSQNTQQPVSNAATGMQHQSFRLASGQGQRHYSQHPQPQQNQQGQVESMQQKLFMLQQQQRKLQQQQNNTQNGQFSSGSQNMQSGQFNSGSNGNNFYS